MFYKLSTLVLFLMLAAPGVAFAQGTGTLAGTVVDDLGDPLPGANVQLGGTTLGAATDFDGNYRIIGVPVGNYDVTASFVGYQEVTISGVDVSSGYTRELNFELSEGETLDEIVVSYQRPIIQKDAIGVPKVISGEDIENLPVRGVAGVAALQGSVVSESGTDDLFIRGGREEEVAYYVDGVKITSASQLAVNQQAIQEQEMLIGTIPPRYGDVQSGVISITTKSGAQKFFGSAELITSEVLDDFGYNLGSLSIGGPLAPGGRASFFLSAQGELVADDSPFGKDTYRLTDDAFAALQQNPQVLRARDVATGEEVFVNFPVQQVQEAAGANGTPVSPDQVQTFVGSEFEILDFTPVNAPDTYTADRFELARGKEDPRDELTLSGSVNFDLPAALTLRVGGAYNVSDRRSDFGLGDVFQQSLYNRDRYYNDERDSWRGYATIRQRFGNNTFYQVQGEFQDYKRTVYPNGLSSDVDGFVSYGDIDGEYYDVARRYYQFRSPEAGAPEAYIQQFDQPGGSIPSLAANFTFALPGRPLTRFQKQHDQQLRFSGSVTTQLGVNQLEIGGEFERRTERLYSAAPREYASLLSDGETYSDLEYRQIQSSISYYGYNYLGTEEVDDEDIAAFYTLVDDNPANANIAPYQPMYYAGYVSDKIEFSDLVIQLGARVDVFDNNTYVLRDLYTPRPIVRVDDLASLEGYEDYQRPNGIGSDYAVYFGDLGNSNEIVGYRDLDGNFYLSDGSAIRSQVVTEQLQGAASFGQLNADTFDEVFEEYEPQVTFMPRLGVSFPVTDRALFFASYNVTSQRPTERAFAAFNQYNDFESSSPQRQRNPGLLPEKTTQYELGVRQRIGERASLTVSGFYRTQDNKITNRRLFGGTPGDYGTYQNEDFTTTRGVELGVDVRRTQNLALNANYTLSFAQGTGSDAGATAVATWRGDGFPNSLSYADFDQRHTLNVSADYRLGEDEGPMIFGANALENFGLNVLFQFGSGQRYTRLDSPNEFTINDSFTSAAVGRINEGTLPATSRVDLRVDRKFNLGLGSTSLKAYLWVQNLFDTANEIAVYRATGIAGSDGYLETTPGQAYAASPGNAFNYSAFAGGPINVGGSQSSSSPYFYSLPRRVRLGFLFNF